MAPITNPTQSACCLLLLLWVVGCSNGFSHAGTGVSAGTTGMSGSAGTSSSTSGSSQSSTTVFQGGTAGAAASKSGGAPATAGTAPACGTANCANPTPACDTTSQSCVTCLSDAHCSGSTPACSISSVSTASNLCVECTKKDHCSDTPSTPACKTEATKCVECLANADCATRTPSQGTAGAPGAAGASGRAGAAGAGGVAGAPNSPASTPKLVCDTTVNACVGCLASTDCAGTPSTPVCDTESKTCVACLSNAHCNHPNASRCDVNPSSPTANTCLPCAASTDCTQVDGKHVCDAGACVECTGKRYDTCGKLGDAQLVCNSQSRTCSADKTEQSAGPCKPCVADAQCKSGQLCAKQTFAGETVGYFCFWKQGDTANGAPGDCTTDTNRPYVTAETTAVSIDNTPATLCTLRNSTCVAVNQFSATPCAPTGTPNDSLCGFKPGEDAKCAPFGTSGEHLCTTTCISNVDCLGSTGPANSTTGIHCDTNVTPRVCTLQ